MEPSGIIVSPYLRDLHITEVLIDAGGRAAPSKAYDADDRCFFVKAFNKPKIAVGLENDAMIKAQTDLCRAFERKQAGLYVQAAKAQVDCDELVSFFDFFQYRGVYYAVFEFIDQIGAGQIEREGLHTRGMIIADAAAGLARLHGCKLFHGDVKPGNILVYQGTDGRAGKEGQKALRGKLIDYDGGCLLTDPPDLRFRLLDFDEVYAAPEFISFLQKAPGSTLDHKMDIFALALTTARILVGKLPMNAVDGLAMGTDPKVLLGLADLPLVLSDLIARGVSLDPAVRPTAMEFHDVIWAWLGRKQVAAKSRQKATTSWFDPLAIRKRHVEPQIVKPSPVTERRPIQDQEETTWPPASRLGRSGRGPRLEGIKADVKPPDKRRTGRTDD